jgi:hypothetical protein
MTSSAAVASPTLASATVRNQRPWRSSSAGQSIEPAPVWLRVTIDSSRGMARGIVTVGPLVLRQNNSARPLLAASRIAITGYTF